MEKIESEKILVSVGRKSSINHDELAKIGVKFHENGIIVVHMDESFQEAIQHIYLIKLKKIGHG